MVNIGTIRLTMFGYEHLKLLGNVYETLYSAYVVATVMNGGKSDGEANSWVVFEF
jgi:hypothetical protein